MNTRVTCGLAVSLCGVWLAGCQSVETVRGQSPGSEPSSAAPQAIQQAGCWTGYPAHGPYGHDPYGGAGPYCGAGGPHQHHHYGCPPAKLAHHLLHPRTWHGPAVVGSDGFVSTPHNMGIEDPGPGWYPTHHHHFSYDVPDDGEYVYPPTFQPPAVVQYPYYTVRGPTDFFMP